jgi:hypothetical protein
MAGVSTVWRAEADGIAGNPQARRRRALRRFIETTT